MKVIIISALAISPFILFSQKYTLENCIDTALENSLNIKIGQSNLNISNNQLKISQSNFYPNINAGAIHGYNWGQTIDLFTNEFATKRVMYDNMYISSSLNIFSGFQKINDVKIQKLNYYESDIDLEIMKKQLKFEIAQLFFQILKEKEIVNHLKSNVDLTKSNKRQFEILYLGNQSTNFKISEIEAQLAFDEYLLLQAENDLKISKLLLQQKMNVKIRADFDITNVYSEYHELTVDTISSTPLDLVKISLQIQQNYIRINYLKGKFFPSIYLNSFLGTGYSQNNLYFNTNGIAVIKPFSNQLIDNKYQSINLNLSIPIYNKNSIKNQINIEEEKLKTLNYLKEIKTQKIEYENEKLILELQNLQSQFDAMNQIVTSQELNLKNTKLLFDNGAVNFNQLSEIINKYNKSTSELLQLKYSIYLKSVEIEFR